MAVSRMISASTSGAVFPHRHSHQPQLHVLPSKSAATTAARSAVRLSTPSQSASPGSIGAAQARVGTPHGWSATSSSNPVLMRRLSNHGSCAMPGIGVGVATRTTICSRWPEVAERIPQARRDDGLTGRKECGGRHEITKLDGGVTDELGFPRCIGEGARRRGAELLEATGEVIEGVGDHPIPRLKARRIDPRNPAAASRRRPRVTHHRTAIPRIPSVLNLQIGAIVAAGGLQRLCRLRAARTRYPLDNDHELARMRDVNSAALGVEGGGRCRRQAATRAAAEHAAVGIGDHAKERHLRASIDRGGGRRGGRRAGACRGPCRTGRTAGRRRRRRRPRRRRCRRQRRRAGRRLGPGACHTRGRRGCRRWALPSGWAYGMALSSASGSASGSLSASGLR